MIFPGHKDLDLGLGGFPHFFDGRVVLIIGDIFPFFGFLYQTRLFLSGLRHASFDGLQLGLVFIALKLVVIIFGFLVSVHLGQTFERLGEIAEDFTTQLLHRVFGRLRLLCLLALLFGGVVCLLLLGVFEHDVFSIDLLLRRVLRILDTLFRLLLHSVLIWLFHFLVVILKLLENLGYFLLCTVVLVLRLLFVVGVFVFVINVDAKADLLFESDRRLLRLLLLFRLRRDALVAEDVVIFIFLGLRFLLEASLQ